MASQRIKATTVIGRARTQVKGITADFLTLWPQCEKIGSDSFHLRSRATDHGGCLDPLARHSRSRSGAGTGAWPDSGRRRIAGRGCSSRCPQLPGKHRLAGGEPAGSTLAWKLASKGVKTIVLDAGILQIGRAAGRER